MVDVAKLTKKDPRTVWPNEASDFTPWLAEHLDELAQTLGMDLELVETEAPPPNSSGLEVKNSAVSEG